MLAAYKLPCQAGALDHNLLAYTAYFTDGSSASYLAAVVPEPSTWAFLAAGLIVLGLHLRGVRCRRMLRGHTHPL